MSKKRKWVLGIVGAAVALGVIGSIGGDDPEAEAAAPTTTEVTSTTEAPTTTVAETTTTSEATTTTEATPETAFHRAVLAAADGETIDGINVGVVDTASLVEFAGMWCNMLDILGADATEEQIVFTREAAISQRPAADEAATRLIFEAAEQHLCPVSERPAAAPTTTVAGPELSVSQENAIEQAESYISHSAFSRTGLIEQLEYEGYSPEDATYAVDHITVDWNEQAAKQAESYLSHSAFSRQGLIDQLRYEGYTDEQATYGVDRVGL